MCGVKEPLKAPLRSRVSVLIAPRLPPSSRYPWRGGRREQA